MNPKWRLKRLVDSSVFLKCDDSLCLFTQSVCLSILKIWGWEEWHKMQHGPRMKIALDMQTQEMPGSDTPISFFDLTLQTWSMYWQVSLMSLVSLAFQPIVFMYVHYPWFDCSLTVRHLRHVSCVTIINNEYPCTEIFVHLIHLSNRHLLSFCKCIPLRVQEDKSSPLTNASFKKMF